MDEQSGIAGAGIYVDGGGSSVPGDPQSKAEVINCTVADNVGPDQDGNGIFIEQSQMTVSNSIFWRNSGSQDFTINSDTEVSLSVHYSSTQYPTPGSGNLFQDPLFADPTQGDYHLRSIDGRWDPAANAGSGAWISDAVRSPALDAGDPSSAFVLEPLPNGYQINLGAHGNTAQASKSSAEFNVAPTDIILSNVTLQENLRPGTIITTLSTIEANTNDRHSYFLAEGMGDADNAAFVIMENTLRAVVPFDYETQRQCHLRLRVEDQKHAAFEL